MRLSHPNLRPAALRPAAGCAAFFHDQEERQLFCESDEELAAWAKEFPKGETLKDHELHPTYLSCGSIAFTSRI